MSDFEEESYKSDSDFEETDSVVWDDSDDDVIDESEKKNELLDQKIKFIFRYNAGAIDIDQFNKNIKNINRSLEDLTFISEYSNNDLLNKEYSFIELIDTYINAIKKGAQPGFLKDYQINTINNLYDEIKSLRKEFIKEKIKDIEPLDSNSLDQTFNSLISDEEKYLKNIVAGLNKKINPKIIIPKRKDYSSDKEYDRAYIEFYRIIGKYIQGESAQQLMNVTSIGSSYEKFEKSVKEKYLEDLKVQQNLPIKVSPKDIVYAKNKMLLKKIMMKMNENQLIECAKQTEIKLELKLELEVSNVKEKFEFNPTVLEKIRKYYKLSNKLSNKLDVIGIITKPLRNKTVQNFIKEIKEEKLMKLLETEIYILTNPNFISYTSKVNDILFIFRNYPNFKKYLLDKQLSVQQLALFEKEIAFETLINVTSIKNRRSVLKQIKLELLKKGMYNSKLVNNYKSNVLSKRLELLIYDISRNEKMYNIFVNKLISIIKMNNIFKIPLENLLLMLRDEQKIQAKEDYSKLSINDINSLISQELVTQDELQNNINIFEKDILTWIPSKIIIDRERKDWERLVKDKNILELIRYKNQLLRKYNLPNDPRLIELKKKITTSNEKYNILKEILIKLKNKETNHYLVPIVNYQIPVKKEIKITRSPSLIKEVIQAYKRKLMIDALQISQVNKNNLISLLELVDFNDISYNRNYLLQKKLFAEITHLLPTGYIFQDFNTYYYNRSIELIAKYLNVPPNKLDKITSKISFIPGQNKVILDYYGSDLIDKIYRIKFPENFYDSQIQKDFYQLNKKSQITIEPQYRRLKVLYDPYTGKFGKDALNGYLFEVEKLSKDNNGKPLEDFTHYESIDPRTGQMIYEKVKIPVPGKFPFIKVPILTNKKGEKKYIWVGVKPELPKMYTNDYDSCSRFNNQEDCNKGKGLGNSNCVYDGKTCKANYLLLKN
jgi:hypothetical protein